ncbi:putative CysO-cysteine peptidase [Magnetospirillum sp. XM-1]|uniref:M67 family metallopeptidase n=1 Tax=Magnetospirillum sp. XM-1 TaxID=1663591 RepID=UPI00073E0938|nr:M67 family metallopeptidase [Magnetospirillum sp. XM-1]CUW41157.1 putative CysO-cysteine peptidase [Magnetospirillum sp. XM-1]
MLVLSAEQMADIATAAEAAWPAEGCGLLIGKGRRVITVTRVMNADNLLKAQGNDRFELDPKVRFAAERSVRGTKERVVGHWHSHPDGSARPSATDLAQAWEPELIWLIVGIAPDRQGRPQAVQMLAHRLDRDAGRVFAVRMETAEKRACQAARFPT